MSNKKTMSVFTDTPVTQTDWKKEILDNIALGGKASQTVKPIIGGHLNHVLNLSSGLPRFQTNVIKRFTFIHNQPALLSVLNPFAIRCCLCKQVISYPCWYYEVKYAVNHFHYFVCFDSASPERPSTKCYRREL
jgi:hypothetical protein